MGSVKDRFLERLRWKVDLQEGEWKLPSLCQELRRPLQDDRR